MLGVLAFVLLASGLLIIWVATVTASGRLGRNALAGIRTASTLASDEAWLAAHRRAKRPTILAGLLLRVGALLVLAPMALDALTVSAMAVGVIAACVLVLACGIYGAVVGSAAARAATEAAADGKAREVSGPSS